MSKAAKLNAKKEARNIMREIEESERLKWRMMSRLALSDSEASRHLPEGREIRIDQSRLQRGAFVRVRKGHETHGGLDGMVVEDLGEEVALIFGFDRYNHGQDMECVGPELWNKDDLDFTTVEE